MKKMPFLIGFLFFFNVSLYAQYNQLQPVLSNNPSSLKWYQVNTPHFRVLFPKGFDGEAQRAANTLEHIHDPEARTMGDKPVKITVVLQNQSSVSNAFVTVTPRHSEFYLMPTQNYNFSGTNDWLSLLASHEYRHVVQYQHAKRGFNKFVYYLFGGNAFSAMAYVGAPQWFWEGDAVATETAFTHSGRGRIPNFGLVFKTNLMEGRTFNYHKQYLRSYKNNIPDHYVLGYHMISYLRKKTNNPEIWSNVTRHSWNVPFIPFTFSNGLKKESGMYVARYYKTMASDLRKDWQQEIDKLHLTPFDRMNIRRSDTYTDYLFPQYLSDGSVLAMKRGIGNIEEFVFIKDGMERKVYTPGFINDTGMLSAVEDRVVWSEYGYDPRWPVKNYSLIKVYDFNVKRRWVIGTKHERYAGASLSPDGEKVVTVRTTNNYQTSLVIMDVLSGKILREFPNPENYFYSMPRWSDDGKNIVVVKTAKEGKTFTIADSESGSMRDVLPVSHENIGHPVPVNDRIFYNSPISGIDNIYVLDVRSLKKFQVTCSKYGAYNPSFSPDGKTMYYNEQARDGLDIVKAPVEPSLWIPVEEIQNKNKELSDYLAEQEGRPGLLDTIPQERLPVKRYSKLKGIINPYSWGPYITNSLTQPYIGIISQDILSTTSINLGYQFDVNERTGSWNASLSYQGIYPILDLSFTQGDRSVNEGDITIREINGKVSQDVLHKDVKFKWTEQNVEGGVRIPLITTQSKYQGNITIGDAVGVTHVSGFRNSITNSRFIPAIVKDDTIQNIYTYYTYQGNGDLIYNHFSLSAYRLLKTSRRDINSKWGQAAYLNYYNTPFGGSYGGGLFSFLGYLYFPGLMKHHSLNFYGSYESTVVDTRISLNYSDYIFRNMSPITRGQSVNRFRRYSTIAANYTFPIWYPDIALGPILNIQRVRLNAFYDYSYGEYRLYDGANTSYSSVGGEVKFDINIMRFLPQLNVGFRYSQGLAPTVSKFEILIGTFNF